MNRPLTLLSSSLLFLALFGNSPAATSKSEHSVATPAIFDSNPDHIWNRLYAALFLRTDHSGAKYGADDLDPLLWSGTQHLLVGPSHQQALALLDEFLRAHAENQIHDPLKRALFQHRLWALFDWSAQSQQDHAVERQELQSRLAEILRRLALTPQEIKSLPDNYSQAVASGAFAREDDPASHARPFLPPDLLEPLGPWVCLRGDEEPVAEVHLGQFSGRSRFLVFVRLPDGRKSTLEYFQTLWNFPDPWAANEPDPRNVQMNPKLPQFPAGTQVALLRQMILIDSNGSLAASPITESFQIRVYRTISSRHDRNNTTVDWPAARTEQGFFEFRLNQSQLFAGKTGGLRPVVPGEKEFPVFLTQGEDFFDLSAKDQIHRQSYQSPILDRCAGCHSAPGINSLQSRRALLRPNRPQFAPNLGRNPDDPVYGPARWESESTLAWKSRRFDWGLLNGYWQARKDSH